MMENDVKTLDPAAKTIAGTSFIALVKSGAVRDVQICRDAECDAVDSQWYDDENAEAYLGIYPGPYRKALKEAAEYALTAKENIRLVPVYAMLGLPEDPTPERFVPGPGIPDATECWGIRRKWYENASPDAWARIAPLHGKLYIDYYRNPPRTNGPRFFMPDKLVDGTHYDDPYYHVSEWEFAPTEHDAVLILHEQARESLERRMLEAEILKGILSKPYAPGDAS